MEADVSILSTVLLFKKDAAEYTFSPIQKLFLNTEHEHQDTNSENFFYIIYRISHSHNCHIEGNNSCPPDMAETADASQYARLYYA